MADRNRPENYEDEGDRIVDEVLGVDPSVQSSQRQNRDDPHGFDPDRSPDRSVEEFPDEDIGAPTNEAVRAIWGSRVQVNDVMRDCHQFVRNFVKSGAVQGAEPYYESIIRKVRFSLILSILMLPFYIVIRCWWL